jgi:hypothetical protein
MIAAVGIATFLVVPFVVTSRLQNEAAKKVNAVASLADGRAVPDVLALIVGPQTLAQTLGYTSEIDEQIHSLSNGYCVTWSSGVGPITQRAQFFLAPPDFRLTRTGAC